MRSLKPLIISLALVAVLSGAGVAFAQTVDPPAPANLVAVNGTNPGEVNLTWDAVPEASFYRIGWVTKPDYEATVAAGHDWLEAFHFVDVANSGQTQWTLTRLSPSVQYYFIAGSLSKRFGGASWSAWSNLLTLTEAPTTLVDYRSQYPNCDSVREHFPGGVTRGSPIYRIDLDEDGDGTACEPASTVPSGNYLPIQDIGTFSGTGDNADSVINLGAGLYRFTTTRNNADGNLFIDVIEIADGDSRSVAIIGRNEDSDVSTLTIYGADRSFGLQAGNYLLEVDTDGDWTVKVELIAAH